MRPTAVAQGAPVGVVRPAVGCGMGRHGRPTIGRRHAPIGALWQGHGPGRGFHAGRAVRGIG